MGRYRAIGGGSPLSRIVERQRAALAAELGRRERAVAVYAAMKHIDPFIADVVRRMATDGIRRVAASGIREVVVSPVGFVADHLGSVSPRWSRSGTAT